MANTTKTEAFGVINPVSTGIPKAIVEIDYTNYKGIRRKRRVRPECIRFGKSAFHKGAQWFLVGQDVESGDWRGFALNDIHSWKPSP